jgi:vacuolar protein sorting-associated protein 54
MNSIPNLGVPHSRKSSLVNNQHSRPGSSMSIPLSRQNSNQSIVQSSFLSISDLTKIPNQKPQSLPLPKNHRPENIIVPKTFLRPIKKQDFDPYLKSIESGCEILKTPNQTPKSAVETLSPKNNLPEVLFSGDFDLNTEEHFELLCRLVPDDLNQNSDPDAEKLQLVTRTELQECLTQNLDEIEVELVSEIAVRSEAFFSALSLLEDLQSETTDCIQSVDVLKSQLTNISQSHVEDSLKIINLKKRKENMERLYSTFKLMEDLNSAQPKINELLSQNLPLEALNHLENIDHNLGLTSYAAIDLAHVEKPSEKLKTYEDVLEKPNSKPKLLVRNARTQSDLNQIKCLSNFRGFVNNSYATIRDILSKEFCTKALSISPDIECVEHELGDILVGLSKINGLSHAIKAYHEALDLKINSVITEYFAFPEIEESPLSMSVHDWDSSQFAKSLKHLTLDNFLKSLDLCFEALTELTKQLITIQKAIQKINSVPKENGVHNIPPLSPVTKPNTISSNEGIDSDFNNSIQQIQLKSGKLVSLRAQQTSKLSQKDFYRLYTILWEFVEEQELITGLVNYALRATLTAQTKGFASYFHTEKVGQLTVLIENEQWTPAQIPVDFQAIVNSIILASQSIDNKSELNQLRVEDQLNAKPKNLLQPDLIFGKERNRSQDNNDGFLSSPLRPSSRVSSPASPNVAMTKLQVDDNEFYTVGCGLVLLKIISEYLQTAINIPILTVDLLQRLVEIFDLFNENTRKLILFAGAMQSAGLKNITAKHLALCSQSLSLFIQLMPYIKKCIHLHSPSQESVSITLEKLDNVLIDYQKHKEQLHDKFFQIMNERALAHIKNMKTTDWDRDFLHSPVATSMNQAHPYMEALLKEITTLYRVLDRYLSVDEVQVIYNNIL